VLIRAIRGQIHVFKINNYFYETIKDCIMEVVSEKIYVDIPISDLTFFKQLADKMGWKVNMRQDL
jgi:hypothetical protein